MLNFCDIKDDSDISNLAILKELSLCLVSNDSSAYNVLPVRVIGIQVKL